jgi:hypothetical protein
MRVFAWCLVFAGLVIGMIRDIDEEVRPAGVIVSPWPGVIAGAGVSAFGVLILAIRRPERSERIE